MPFVYDETEMEWPDDDSEPPPPRPDQFVYLAPPQFGGAREPVQFSIMSPGVATDASEPQWKKLAQKSLAIMLSALREIGGRRAYCRYDGGHDEGFAWLDSIELRDGTRINADAVAQRLYDVQVHSRLRAADLYNRPEGFSDLEHLRNHLRHWLCNEWATMLLGDSYGTGEYSMYGAFTVDLEACTIADDPQADPVVENIAIAT
jgi:hypothetical protein